MFCIDYTEKLKDLKLNIPLSDLKKNIMKPKFNFSVQQIINN